MSHERIQFPLAGFLRLPQVLSLFPIGKSSWWRGVKEGRYPKPVRIAPRTSAWRTEDITALLECLGRTEDYKTRSEGGK